mgnify:CR=1 FL=1
MTRDLHRILDEQPATLRARDRTLDEEKAALDVEVRKLESQVAILEKQGAWLEAQNADMAAKDAPAELKRQQEAGIQVVKLDDAQAKLFLKTAYDAAWNALVAASPVNGPKLRELMAKG